MTHACPSLFMMHLLKDQGCKDFVLAAGDCLYIPRGFPHVAQTDEVNPSFHLSLGLEVEPFMEWSAALHVALRLIHQAKSEPAIVAADAASSQEAASAAIRAVENTSEETRRDSTLVRCQRGGGIRSIEQQFRSVFLVFL